MGKQVPSLKHFPLLLGDTTCGSQLLAKQIPRPIFLSMFTEVNAGGGEPWIDHSLSCVTGKWVFDLVLCYRNLFRNLLEKSHKPRLVATYGIH